MYTAMKMRLDADKDGVITRADYRLVLQRYREMGISDEHLKKLEKAYSDT